MMALWTVYTYFTARSTNMLSTSRAYSGFSVDDMAAAKTFYGETLGLNVTENAMGFLTLNLGGGGSVLVYDKPNHEPASFTVLNFPVENIDEAVTWLNERGVTTKIYTDPDFGTDERGIVRGNGPDIAWFRDPAGNVISVLVE
jgi:predicted enzyme related to lactoylglutathione lyase